MNKFELVSKVEKQGYVFDNEVLPKLVGCFYEAGLRVGGMVPAALLTGLPGAGKTFLAECFAKALDAEVIFYQITEDTNSSTLVGDINPAEVVRGNANGAVSDGALIKAAKAEKPIVLILDEWDKGAQELDAFLLDFLQSRRVRDLNGDMQYLPDSEVWVFLTSNEDRNISDALSRRVRKWEVEKLSKERVAELLGIEPDNQLLVLWEGIPELALSQLEAYIQDMGGPEYVSGDIDTVIMRQYIDIPQKLTLTKPEKVSSEPFITVTVQSRAEYWDIECALMGHPIKCSEYSGYSADMQQITFEMKNVADWLRFGSNLKDMLRDTSDLHITSEMQTGDSKPRGAYIPLLALERLVKRYEVYDNHVAVITQGGKLLVAELIGDLSRFEDHDITDLFRGG